MLSALLVDNSSPQVRELVAVNLAPLRDTRTGTDRLVATTSICRMTEGQRPRRMSAGRVVLAISGVSAASVSLLDLVGLLDIPAIADKLPQLTLLISGLVLMTLAINISAWHSRVFARLSVLNQKIEDQAETTKLAFVALERSINNSLIETFPSLIDRVL
ncbi:MAG: hypothetical protein LC776_12605 [Acidobacteria bacterium]|nr:hypothetical protein [Acidobacteriota bacterium]